MTSSRRRLGAAATLDLFAGPGGWASGLRMLGLTELGMEWDQQAVATRVAAGHTRTIRCDVADYPTRPFAGRTKTAIASPPCQPWSRAGKRLALLDQPLVHQAVHDLSQGHDTRAELKAQCKDERSLLAAEPMRWHHDLRPETILLEQVPDVLPLWRHYAVILRGWGYSVWCGELNAADYGIPQTRRRAILIASRVRDISAPTATHAEHPQGDHLFGPGLLPWVTMADALDLPADDPRLLRSGNQSNAAVRHISEPAPTMAFGHNSARVEWVFLRPATTVCATDRIAPPGHRDRNPGGESQFASPDTVRITQAEAGVLQTFPADYPWQGSKTAQFAQIGNAVPPLLAAHIAAAGLGLPASVGRAQDEAA